MNNIFHYVLIIACVGCLMSCKKSKYLDKKPDNAIVVPTTLAELQSILDNSNIMNGMSEAQTGINPALGEAFSDDYYIVNGTFPSSYSDSYKNLYKWNDDIYVTRKFYDWAYPYRCVFYSNVVLDGIAKLDAKKYDIEQINSAKGSALFFRSQMFFQLAQIFAPHYSESTQKTDLGIAIKLNSDINEKISRETIDKTYKRIIADLQEATVLLPANPLFKTRPSKPAAFGMLARAYLVMQKYDSALKYSNECLKIANKLIDYNELDSAKSFPFLKYNSEVLFHSCLIQSSIGDMFLPFVCRVDSNLIKQYDENDLRRGLFFKSEAKGKSFRGSYDGTRVFFGGIAIDEIYLIRAECLARAGDIPSALSDLNYLLKNRWRATAPFSEYYASNSDEALKLIYTERRKELLFRGIRWMDLRRLNKMGANIFINRVLDGTPYTLAPNDPRYTFLIPPDVISFNPNMPKNPR